jgi:hypothetical protein
MSGGASIGRAGRAATRVAARLRAAGRREAAVPGLAFTLLTRARPPAPVRPIGVTRLELSVAVQRAETYVAAPEAAPAQVPAPGRELVRETLRERVERTLERVLAHARRQETADPPAPAAAQRSTATPPAPPAAFPPLRLALAPPVPAMQPPPPAPGQELEPGAAAALAGPPAPVPAGPPAAPGPLADLPLVVDRVVDELDRRTRAQRERRGWIG